MGKIWAKKKIFPMCILLFLISFFCSLEASKPALVVYLSNPATRQVKTRLAKGTSKEIATTFYQHCLSILSEDFESLQDRYDIFAAPANANDVEWCQKLFPMAKPLPQSPLSNLGERIQKSLNDVLAMGYSRVLLIGSDAPSLPTEFLHQCFDQLDKHHAVLGPCDDGGFYLIGTNTPAPDLTHVRWSTNHAFKDTAKTLSKAGLSVGSGPGWYDVDEVELLWRVEKDLQQASGKRASLSKWIGSLPKVSIIVPLLNEEKRVGHMVEALRQLKPTPEIICVDGNSRDATRTRLQELEVEPVVVEKANRGRQINAGLEKATGSIFLILHADTSISQEAYQAMITALENEEICGGAFSYALETSEVNWRLRFIERGVSLRNILFTLPYGDQGYFIKKRAFCNVGPFKELALMEDVEWFGRLKKHGNITILPQYVTTSPRRILAKGPFRSSLLNITLVALYQAGVDPDTLASFYYR